MKLAAKLTWCYLIIILCAIKNIIKQWISPAVQNLEVVQELLDESVNEIIENLQRCGWVIAPEVLTTSLHKSFSGEDCAKYARWIRQGKVDVE